MADPTYMRDAKPVAATPDYMRNAQPVSPDPDIIAHAAADDTKKSAQAIDVSKQTGLALGYIAGGLDESIKAIQKQKFAAQLYGRPVMSDWAAQSPQHAALVRPDAEELGKTEGWFSGWGDALGAGLLDIMHAEAMREYMGYSLDKYRSQSAAYVESKVREFAAGGRDPRDVAAFRWKLQHPSMGPLGGDALSLETAAREYDSKPHGFPQAVLRAVPQIGLYTGGAVVAGPVGVAGLLYAQNKGVLARQIQLAQTNSPDKLTPEEVDKYATVGSAASAVATAGLLGPLLRSMPGAKEALQATVGTVFERGVSTGLGQAFIRSLSSYGIHSFMGATGMALQASINAATVRKATSGELDFGQFGRETADTFWKVLPIALTFSAYGPARDFMADRGRLNMAPLERARLDEQVALAKKMQLTKTAPERALELFGLMGRGAKVFIDWKAAKTMEGLPPADVAAAEAAQDSVAVPMADYLTKLADQHESVKDDVKLTAGGMTMNEARARDKELRALGPEAQTLLGKQTPDDVLQYELPFPKEAAVPEAKPAAAATTAEPKFQASFQNKETGEVINTGAFHDLTKLPGGTNAHAGGKFVDGFTDQTGKFYTREEAAKALNVKGKELASGGLATEDLARMQKERLAEVAAEMAKLYGGTVEKWQERLTPELMDALREEGSKGAVAPEEHAARVIEAMPSGEIDAAPYERLAKKSQKYIEDAAEKARSGSAAGAQASSPADVAVLSTYELARDVNNAKAAKATEVRAEMDKISETLNKAAGNDKLRALLARAGSPLLHLFDVLTESSGTANPKSVLDANRKGWMAAHQEAVAAGAASFSPEAIAYANERMRNSLGEALQWFSDAARPVQFDERVLAKFLADPKPLKELRPFEVRAISDAVKQITTAAKEEGIIRRGDAQATVDEVSAEIRGELRQNPSKGLPQPSGVPTGFWRDRLLDANAANAVQLRPKNNLRQKSAAAAKWIFDRINQAVYVRDGYFRDVGEKWKTAFDAAPPEVAKLAGNTYDLSDKLPTPGMEPLKAVPRQYIWKLARHRMSAGNMERVLSTSGWDGAVVDKILFDDPATKLTVPEWDYLQSLADVNEKYVWPKLKEHFEKFYGLAPPKTAGVPFKVQLADGTWKDYAGGYEPLKRDARPGVAPQAEPTKGIAQYWGRDFQTPWTPGSVKERVDNSHYLVNMDWDSSRATMARALHWLAFDQPVRDVAKLLNDQRLAADMNEFMGEGRADMTRGWLKSSATQQSQSVPEGMEIVGRMFGWQRRLQLMQIVGGSARLAVTQLSHPIGLMLGGEVNPIHGIGAFFSTFKPVAHGRRERAAVPELERRHQLRRRSPAPRRPSLRDAAADLGHGGAERGEGAAGRAEGSGARRRGSTCTRLTG
jgi:hypothetical protein